MEELFTSLNERQLEAVTYRKNCALRVIAGPGTGKTKVLTARFCHLIVEKKIHPLRIIMTTFTRKAANEVKNRVEKIMNEAGIPSEGLLIGTFHSIFSRLLHQWGHLIDLPKKWTIAKKEDILSILKQILDYAPEEIKKCFKIDFNLDSESLNARLLLSLISDIKAMGMLPSEYKDISDHKKSLLYCYTRLQELLLSEMLLDFDDILLYGKVLMKKHVVWKHICHVLVDEFQDTNTLQLDLIYLLSQVGSNPEAGFTVVGDPDQSIYAFRFASANNFNKVIEMSPIEHATVSLVENYRSAQSILDLSESIISQQQENRIIRDPLRAQFSHSIKPFYCSFRKIDTLEGNNEANGIAREIIYLMALRDLFSYSDIAILLRTRRQFDDIERGLIRYRIPYKIVNAKRMWEQKECTVFLDFLRILTQDYCSLALLRCLAFSAKGVGNATLKRLHDFLERRQQIPSINALEIFFSTSKSNKTVSESIEKFICLVKNCKLVCIRSSSYDGLKDLFRLIYYGLGFSDSKVKNINVTSTEVKGVKGQEEFEKELILHPTINMVYQHFVNFKVAESDEYISIVEDKEKGYTLSYELTDHSKVELLEVIRLFSNSISLYLSETEVGAGNQSGKGIDCVTVSTIHAAKGLEWAVCFIPSINEGLIPFESKGLAQRIEDAKEINPFSNDLLKSSGTAPVEDILLENLKNELYMKEKLSDVTNEERRIFFVAITRAKHLLYLSSSGQKSRFLDSCQKNYSTRNSIYENEHSVRTFYQALGKKYISNDSISLETLLKDYHNFQKFKKETMFWNGNEISVECPLDYSTNKKSTNIIKKSTILTTASQLLVSSIGGEKKYRRKNYSSRQIDSTTPYALESRSAKEVTTCNKKRKVTITDFFKTSTSENFQSVQLPNAIERYDHVKVNNYSEEGIENRKFDDKLSADTSNIKNDPIVSVESQPKKIFAPPYTPIRNNNIKRSRNRNVSVLSTNGYKTNR